MDEYLYSAEEDKRQKHEHKRKEGKGPDNEPRLRARRLEKAWLSHSYLALPDIDTLLARDYDHPVVSLYLTITAQSTQDNPATYMTVFNTMKDRIFRDDLPYTQALSHDDKKSLKEDFTKIEHFLRLEFEGSDTKTLIIFRSGKTLNHVIRLPILLTDKLHIGSDPFVEPLVAVLAEYPHLLGIHVKKEEAELFTYSLGVITLRETIKNFVPTNTVDASRPGHIQRHRIHHMKRHLKDVLTKAKNLSKKLMCDGIIVFTTDEKMTNEIVGLMDPPLKAQLIDTHILQPEATDQTMKDQIETSIMTRKMRREKELLADLPRYQVIGRVTAGLPETIKVQNRQLLASLYIDLSLAHPGFHCAFHPYLALAPGTCPFDDTPLLPANNIIDELVEAARNTGVSLHFIHYERDRLMSYGGVAGVKRS